MLSDQTRSFSVALYDPVTNFRLQIRSRKVYPAASTMKIGIILAAYRLNQRGKLNLNRTISLRNRFRSIIDGTAYRVPNEIDKKCNCLAYRQYVKKKGSVMSINLLARDMIQSSSNLATNLLIRYIGVWRIRRELARLKIRGLSIRRGLYDIKAYDLDRHNTLTAEGALLSFQAIVKGSYFDRLHRDRLLRILSKTEHRDKIPALLPEEAFVAQKSGSTSDVSHDAGIIYPARDSRPYYLAILSEGYLDSDLLDDRIAQISRIVYDSVLEMRAQIR